MNILFSLLGLVIAGAFAYLLGSLNSALVVCRIVKGQDIRKYGSNNAGLTNVLRTYGKGLALTVLLCDLFKGIIAVTFARIVVVNIMGVEIFGDGIFVMYFAAFCAMMGHIFPLYYGFKGGKGVLVAATSLLAIDPLSFVCAILVFILVVYFTKYVSVASIIASMSFAVFTLLWQFVRGIDTFAINAAVVHIMATIIVWKHKPNMERIDNGTENKLSFKKK